MKKIPLTKGQFTMVDDDMYEELSKYKWCAHWAPSINAFYAVRTAGTLIHMHRVVMDCQKGLVVDHINHNPLDNQRGNLRICTHGQNLMNRKIGPKNKSGYKGVSWDKVNMKWKAQISVNNKTRSIGRFIDILDAARAYNKAALKYYGDFAYMNIIKEDV